MPGVLRDFDLPDVAAAIAPRPTWIVNPRTPTLALASIVQVTTEYGPARQSFERSRMAGNFHILERAGLPFERVYAEWIGKKTE